MKCKMRKIERKKKLVVLSPNSKQRHDYWLSLGTKDPPGQHIVFTQHSLSSHLSRAGLWALHWTQWGYVILIPNKSACSYLLRWLRKTIELRIPLIRLLNISWIVYLGDVLFFSLERRHQKLSCYVFVILVAIVDKYKITFYMY